MGNKFKSHMLLLAAECLHGCVYMIKLVEGDLSIVASA